MLRANRRDASLPRAELDQRAREARLRLEQLERLLVSHGSGVSFLWFASANTEWADKRVDLKGRRAIGGPCGCRPFSVCRVSSKLCLSRSTMPSRSPRKRESHRTNVVGSVLSLKLLSAQRDAYVEPQRLRPQHRESRLRIADQVLL